MITMIFSDKVPLYRQLYLHIRDEIFQHKLKEGEYLPSKRALANHLNISQNTVINAYQQLQDEGYIQSEERKGFYVLPIDFQVRAPEEPELDVPLCTTELYKYDFSHNSIDPNSFPISTWGKLTKESLYNYSMDMTTQGDNKGHEKLRQALCNYLRENRGINVSADQIVIRSGVESMLPLVFHLIPDNLHFALEDPGYNRLKMVLESHGISYENRKIDNMGLPADYSSNANVICVTPSHQFPTGTIMPIGRRQELLRWANETGGYILEDDYDSEFKYQGRPIPPMKSMDVGDRIIYFGSFSKCLSPALRTSYMVLPKELTSRFDALKHLPGPTVPTLTQLTLATFISKGHFQRHLNRMRNLYRKRREAMVNTLNQWDFPHFISGAEAGIHLLLHLPGFKKRKELLNNISKHKINITVSDYRSETAKSEESTLLLGFGSMNIEDIQNGLQLLLKTIESISQEE